ncbi:hypothetical protein LINPERPRIM_LOCUS8553 [Linum perenne]
MAEWSKAPDSSSGPLTRAWVQIPLLTIFLVVFHYLFRVVSGFSYWRFFDHVRPLGIVYFLSRE